MANQIYPLAREEFLGGDLDWDLHDFKLVLLSSAYVYSSAHQDVDDLTGIIDTSANLASKTKTNGYAGAATVVVPLVAGGSTIRSIVIYRDTGVTSTSRLVYYADTTSTGVAINVATDGSDVTVPWPAQGIFRL